MTEQPYTGYVLVAFGPADLVAVVPYQQLPPPPNADMQLRDALQIMSMVQRERAPGDPLAPEAELVLPGRTYCWVPLSTADSLLIGPPTKDMYKPVTAPEVYSNLDGRELSALADDARVLVVRAHRCYTTTLMP